MLDGKCTPQSGAAARSDSAATHQEQLIRALDHLRAAIALLDAADAPPHIAAHVDLALHQLQLTMASTK